MVAIVVSGFAMLVLGSIFLDMRYGEKTYATEDDSHLQDPNAHLEDLVTYARLTDRRLAQA